MKQNLETIYELLFEDSKKGIKELMSFNGSIDMDDVEELLNYSNFCAYLIIIHLTKKGLFKPTLDNVFDIISQNDEAGVYFGKYALTKMRVEEIKEYGQEELWEWTAGNLYTANIASRLYDKVYDRKRFIANDNFDISEYKISYPKLEIILDHPEDAEFVFSGIDIDNVKDSENDLGFVFSYLYEFKYLQD